MVLQYDWGGFDSFLIDDMDEDQTVRIVPFWKKYQERVKGFVLDILNNEFGLPCSLREELDDIAHEKYYRLMLQYG